MKYWNIFFVLPLFLFHLSVYSQSEFNNWYFGFSAGITFNFGNPAALINGSMNQTGRCPISVSDSLGNLLFYSSGNKIFAKNHAVMPNGTNLFGGIDGAQPVFSVKSLVDDSLYFLFTVGDNNWYNGGLCYSLIDLRLNGGLGDIVVGSKNIPVTGLQDARLSLTGTRHKNNRDVWIVTSKFSPAQQYSSFLVTANGISSNQVISVSLISNISISPYNFFIKISQDGSRYVTGSFAGQTEFGSFDNQTGIFNPFFKFKVIHGIDSLSVDRFEFSPDSKKLYVTGFMPVSPTIDSLFLFQLDATKLLYSDFMQSMIEIGNCENKGHNCLQLATDNKIYLARLQDTMLSVINSPNIQGSACNFQKRTIGLSGRSSTEAFPQFLQKYYTYMNFQDVCEGDTVRFISSIWPPADTIQWNFGDPTSGIFNLSALPNPSHFFAAPGTYTVSLYVRHNDNRTDTVLKTVHVYAYPNPDLGPDRTICVGDTYTFDAGSCPGCTYSWSNLTTGQPNIATGQTYTTGQAGIYKVDVLNVKCSGSDTVQLLSSPVPQVTNSPLFKTICSGESTNILLTSNGTGVMFHWTTTLSSGNISGFSSDSGLIINQTLINLVTSPGVVTYYITPEAGSCIGTTIDFPVTINVGDLVDVTITASGNSVCADTPVTFTAAPVNPGTIPVFQWKVNGINAGSNAPTFNYVPASGDNVNCILTSSNTVCTSNNPATSNTIMMIVNQLEPVSVSVSPALNPVCAGTPVNFTAIPVNGGTTPQYQWKVNGLIAGTNSPNYSYFPVNGDAITCTLTSDVLCPSGNPATSIPVVMAVNPLLAVGISIVTSSNPFCAGSPVTFTATPVNGGISPSYQWNVNGINSGINSPVLIYSPANGDVVSCSLLSSETCTTGNPAQSTPVTMVVNANLPAGITIAASTNPFCPGSPVTFTANPLNGGPSPVFQWKVNGINSGSNASTFLYNPVNNDSVRCILTSNLNCVTGSPVGSAKIIMSGTLAPIVSFTSCFDTVTTVGAKAFKLKGGIPLGGTYSGPGVNGMTGIFTPSVAGTGLKTILYTYTNVASCSAGKSKAILVQPNPVFTCGNSFSDIRDGQSYPTVQIGTHCWMAANLNYGSILNSSQIQNDNCISEKYCYNDVTGNCTKYGGLYQWDEMMKYDDTPAGQGLCPPGWHVPTDSEWTILFNFYQGNALSGKPLQDTILSGFKAQTSGVFYLNSSWSFNGFATLFWSSTPWSAVKAISHGMNIYDFSVSLYPSSKANAFPIRCLKD